MADALIARVEKRFASGATVAAEVEHDEGVLVLFGPSGAGKTTVLRAVAGLDRPDRGLVRFGGETWLDTEAGIFLSPQRRHVGLLFQDYALCPHMSVRANVAYGLGALGAREREARVDEALALVGAPELAGRATRGLSGGEQPRVALARTLAPRPRLLLLDEPLSALDAPSREHLRRELRRVLRAAGAPSVVVTHDRTEALALGDRVAVLDGGRVRQAGPIDAVFARPADPAVARIVGVETVAPGTVESHEEGIATVAVGTARVAALAPEPPPTHVFVCIRAEEVILERGVTGESSARNRLPGRVVEVVSDGPMARVTIDCGFPILAVVTAHSRDALGLVDGAEVTAVVKAPSVHLIPRE